MIPTLLDYKSICRVYVGYMYIQVHMGSMPGKEEEGGTDAVADTANRKIQLMVDAPIYDNSSKLKSLKKALKICEYCIVTFIARLTWKHLCLM